jgi:nicotinate-nucleotide adenylyltransferase
MSSETETVRRLGIMGGTFDPIHYGHLVTAEGARYEWGLEKVIFIPAGRPPHKPGLQITEPWDRYVMTGLAIESNPFFQVSVMEIERPGPSYTVDTVSAMQVLYPESEIFFITGSDAVLEVLTWKDVPKLLSKCRFISVSRPGYNLDKLHAGLDGIPEELKKKIIYMQVPSLAISSTEIRKRVREGRPVKYLLPESVENYIMKKELYRQ